LLRRGRALIPHPLVLWAIAALIAAGITFFSLLPHHTARGDVSGYIKRANERGTSFTRQYQSVSDAYRKLGHGTNEAQLARLRVAARNLGTLRAEIAAIPAPPAAQRLRRLLVAYYRGQEAVANELVAVVAYFPQLRKAEAPVQPAASRLNTALRSGSTDAKQQAAALAAYAAVLGQAARTVGAIDAPAAVKPARDAERRRLAATRASILGVRRALVANDRAALKNALDTLAATTSKTGAARATRAAVVSYNHHVDDLQQLGAKVERERRRLEGTL
jgi:hypothetical protein